MKTLRSLLPLTLAAVALSALVGCNTFDSRAREKSATFESLTPDTQERLQRGSINVGDTQDMVYIALGTADEKRQVSTADGTSQTWIYRSYWEQYQGSQWVGWRRVIVPTGRGYAIFHEPITRDVYSSRVDEIIRVSFDSRGVVSSVEQRNRDRF